MSTKFQVILMSRHEVKAIDSGSVCFGTLCSSYEETFSVDLATFTNIDFISSVFVFRLGNEAAASPKVFLTLWHHQHLHHPPMPLSMFPGSMP